MTSLGLLRPLACLLVLTFSLTGSPRAAAQGPKMKAAYNPAEDEDRDRPEERARWMRRGREAPAGQSAAALRLRAHQHKLAMRTALAAALVAEGRSAASAGSQGWASLGPAPLATDPGTYGFVSGRATAVAIDPSDTTGNTVYVAGAYGGVWKSTNAAALIPTDVSWIPITDQQASLANGAVSVKSDGSVVLVGTGEPDNALDSYYGVGILRSTNHGASWAPLIAFADGGTHPFAGLGFSKFAWLPGSNTVVAATATTTKGFDEGAITANTNRGLYLSTDNGQTWSYQALTDGSTPISATDVTYNSVAGKFFAAIRYHGLYSSVDGTNWTRLTSQPNPAALSLANCPTAAVSTCPMYRGQLATVPGRNEMYFWFVDINDNDEGIWRSTDGGQTWIQIDETGLTNCGDTYGCGTTQGFYNLEISAVPDGPSATDLYAGAVNLFKCTLTDAHSTVCNGNDWLNLTHVYGCPSIAGVHPDQHGLDFMLAGGKAIMYFANDGGIYRALDGYLGLTSGTCGVANQFDDLNASTVPNGTIGSMTQLVSLSLDPTLKDVILGGSQDNGSPATATATASPQWTEANNGDGGYNAINPSNPSQWFASHDYVSIELCENGAQCTSSDFNSNQIVSSATLAGDVGAFYTPFILDPQNTGEMLVGTCRVWRGSATAGSGFSKLSVDFETLSPSAVCTGNEVNVVRGLAAGGPQDHQGFSNVIYATTEGTGPNCTAANGCNGPAGGEVWVTTNAAQTLMANVTGNINPENYTISSVAVDTSDMTGKTAYVGIMGFGASHVFKTTDAGGTGQPADWTDWSGTSPTNLPPAPVNALLIDAAAGAIYAGTDEGVFVSSTVSPSWTEVPAAGSGTGFLPNVPVSALRMFNPDVNHKILRASTYGRGVWEYTLVAGPDFQVAISNTPQTVFASQTATFSGVLTALNGYNSAVNLSCAGSPPPTCTLNPTQVKPTPSGAAFTLTASGPTADYSFTVHAVGTDTYTTTHDAPLTLHVVDFGLTAPNPATVTAQITAQQGGTSNSTAFQVTAGGSFSGTVALTCLPPGTTCNFSPSASVSPAAANPVNASLTVSVPAGAAPGSTTVTIQAATAGAPAPRTQPLTLTVIAPDLAWASSGSSTATVMAGVSATYNFTATPTSGTFASTVSFACAPQNLPPQASCTFSPTQITANTSGAQPVQLTIATAGPNTGPKAPSQSSLASGAMGAPPVEGEHSSNALGLNGRFHSQPWLPLMLPVAALLLAGLARTKLPRSYSIATLSAALVLIALLIACQSVTQSSQPPPQQQITVTVTLATGQPASLFPNNAADGWPPQTAQFTATVTNTTNTAVIWTVTAANGGTVDGNGLYSAPTVAPGLPATVKITATSVADPSKSGSALEALIPATIPDTYNNITVTATDNQGTLSQAVSLTVQ